MNKKVNLNVKIPKGIKNGQKIRLAGQGSPSHNGGQPGDMYIKVLFKKHRIYKFDGVDVYMDLPVAPWEAMLGSSVDVPTPTGKIKLNVPAGTSHGKKLRVKGKGIPAKKQGDLYVVINIVLPPASDKKAKKIYSDYGKYLGVALSNYINIFNPDIIVLGGEVSNAYSFYSDSMKKEIKKRALFKSKIVKNTLKDAGIIGAAALAL